MGNRFEENGTGKTRGLRSGTGKTRGSKAGSEDGTGMTRGSRWMTWQDHVDWNRELVLFVFVFKFFRGG
jgi:hypothetical protein